MTGTPLLAFHRSNALTYLSLGSAVGAIAGAAHGSASAAGALIAAAVIADTFDGRFARLFPRTAAQRTLGAQLDSLSDAVSFGAAPGLCTMLLVSRSAGLVEVLWWVVLAVFAACAIARLAFYNVADQDEGFTGLPAPVAALTWSSVLLFDPGAAATIAVMLMLAAAMVVPLRIPRPAGAALAAFAAWPLTVIVAHVLSR